jgi:hypothetical protein
MRQTVFDNPCAEGEKFAVVAHARIICALTAEGLDESDPMGFKNYQKLDNCQLLPYKV